MKRRKQPMYPVLILAVGLALVAAGWLLSLVLGAAGWQLALYVPGAAMIVAGFILQERAHARAMQEAQRRARKRAARITPRPEEPPRPPRTAQDYCAWIAAHLPAEAPAGLVKSALTLTGEVRGLAYWSLKPDLSPDRLVFTAKDEDEMQDWLYRQVTEEIASAMAERRSLQEKRRWRYVRERREGGRWLFTDSETYEFDAIYDPLKLRYELQLWLMKGGLTDAQYRAEAVALTRLLNAPYAAPHWAFDEAQAAFVEISHAPRLGKDGAEEPRPGSVLPRSDASRKGDPAACAAWINARLPADLRDAMALTAADVEKVGEVRGLAFWRRLPETFERAYVAWDEEDLRRWLYSYLFTFYDADRLRPRYQADKARWRYVADYSRMSAEGRVRYLERAAYEFNACYQLEKPRSEAHLRAVRGVLPGERVDELIAGYERQLNQPFPAPHWAFDRATFTFVEISDSHQRDMDGREIIPLEEE